MFGFLIGIACLAGLIHHKRRACGFGHGRHASGGRRHQRHRRRFKRHLIRHKVDHVLDHVDASDEQAREVHGIVEEFLGNLSPLKEELRAGKRGMADVAFGDDLQEVELDALFDAQRDLMKRAQGEAKDAITKLHATLDAEQRTRLSELFGRRFTKGPFR